MSQENVELVRSAAEAWKRGDVEAALSYLDPEVRLDLSARPDGQVWHGRDGYRRAMIDWIGAWIDWEFEIEGVLDAGENRVALLFRESGRGKTSGLPMSMRPAMVITLRNGLILSSVGSPDRSRALADLGLEE